MRRVLRESPTPLAPSPWPGRLAEPSVTSDAGPDPRPDLDEHVHVGRVIEGKVTRHAPFGIFVDIGNPHSPGLAEFPDEYPRGMAAFPAIGSQLTCVVVGFRRMQPDGRMQAQVSLRPSRLRAAACVGRVEALPPEHRFAFLRELTADGDAAVTEAAAWRARLL